MTTLELREKRAKAWEAAKAFLDTHRNGDGLLSAEDDAVYTRMENDIAALGKEISRMERADALEMELNKPMNTPLTIKPEAPKTEKEGRASNEYKKAFWNHIRKRGGVQDALKIGTDSEGGYLVPDEFEHTLISALEEENIIRKFAHVFTTSSGAHKIPIVSTRGSASWVDEEGTIQSDDDAFGQQLIGAHKVATLMKVSEELLADSAFDLESYIKKEFARRIGNAEEEAFLTGDGKNKPTGILDATLGAQLGVTAAAEAAITADEIIDLFYSLRSPYRKKAIWVLNDSTIKLIRKLKDQNGQYLWQPALRDGEFDTILGKRIDTSPFAPVATAGARTIAFGDFSYYWIGDRQGISFKRLNDKYAETGQVGFLATKRVDGKLILPEAIKVLQQKSGE